MDIAQDHKHHRKTQQRIQTKNKAHGDRGRGEILLYPPRLYCSKNGTALEVKPHWKGAQKPASLEDFGAVKIYTIYLTLPCFEMVFKFVERAQMAENELDLWVERLVGENMPVFSRTVQCVAETASRENSSLSELAWSILEDPTLTAQVLK